VAGIPEAVAAVERPPVAAVEELPVEAGDTPVALEERRVVELRVVAAQPAVVAPVTTTA
jgi:hypothetical protein